MTDSIKVAELFAGVGGFRLGLDGYSNPEHPEFTLPPAGPFRTVWANQWEPDGKESRQFAWRCYEKRFGEGSCVNEDIKVVLDQYENGERSIPDFQMLVGGFPCQDYSVAKPLAKAGGIEGKKGVLWWQIYRLLQMRKPKYVLLENVDRLLKSPVKQRGRDFAIILSCFAALGYSVEWRIINAADYGMPQRRRRVYIYAVDTQHRWDLQDRLTASGVEARAFPIDTDSLTDVKTFPIPTDPYEATQNFGKGDKVSKFANAGVMQNATVYTARVEANWHGTPTVLGDIIVPDDEVPEQYFIPADKLDKWRYFKGAKHENRIAANGHPYVYSEGAMDFPDSLDKPARTILTGDGGAGASRTKHVVQTKDGRYRRLVPDELDQVQMFPKGWTNSGMSDSQRAFCMGNALVVGIPHAIGAIIAQDAAAGAD
ncbi:MAG: DNA (cytosine-5-)-methyltransferase [Bifidobacteriaceae bacterium]|nr:DNA (cytosine-5-)-methyltransferase [Bifidobacteriaceae bacterium]